MGLSTSDSFRLLLLDLDCVTIYGGNPRDGLAKEIHLLHPDLAEIFAGLDMPVVLLTHRSFQDATYIRNRLELCGIRVSGLVSSRELFLSAARQLRIISLLSKGLSKSFALDWLERKYNINRQQMLLVDDRRENLLELTQAGMHSGILAPFKEVLSPSTGDSFIETFCFQEISDKLKMPVTSHPEVIELTPERRPHSDLTVIGEIEGEHISVFERIRQTVKTIRDFKRKLLTNN